MNTCEFKEFCDKDCNTCLYANEQKTIQAAHEAFETLKNAIIECVAAVYDALTPLIINAVEAVADLYDKIIKAVETYPNKRVVYLAAHGKKARTRKKNQKRIFKWIIDYHNRTEQTPAAAWIYKEDYMNYPVVQCPFCGFTTVGVNKYCAECGKRLKE